MNDDLTKPKPLPPELEIKIVLGEYDKDQLLEILENHALSPTQANTVGNAFRQLAEYDLAEKYFLKSIELSPTYDEPYAHLISLYALQKKFDLSKEIFWKGLKNAARKSFIIYHDGRVHFLQGDYKTSLMAGRCILMDENWNDEDAIIMVIKSLIMLIRKNKSEDEEADFEEARLAWERGLTLFPDSEELQQFSKIFSEE